MEAANEKISHAQGDKAHNYFTITQNLYDYMLNHSLRESPEALALRQTTSKHSQAMMMNAPDQAQFMAMLVKLINAKNLIEVGTFTGYTSLVLAQALPENGRITCLDINDEFVKIGIPFWKQANVESKIDLIIAPAEVSLKRMLEEGKEGGIDFAFVDADKNNYDIYYELLLRLVRKNGLIVVDNTLWHGKVLQETPDSPLTAAIMAFNEKIAKDDRVDVAFLGVSDGVTLLRKK